ncbi:MAG: hypothetical protein M1828_000205 [Chrysothrix sp. TS-e1954]|nr:MAG: hypothetical protein M1828_000205 [Chrysothrix sp. TS-e1954]
MSSWLDEYLHLLKVRDSREKANEKVTNAYTALADHTGTLHKDAAVLAKTAPIEPSTTGLASRGSKASDARLPSARIVPTVSSSDPTLLTLRNDLVAANKTTAALNAQLESLQAEITRMESASSAQKAQQAVLEGQVRTLAAERTSLARRLRDRESEIKEKARLVENVQDEMVGLEMQVNVAESKARKVEEENKHLVERWMKRMGSEAEEMNEGSGWT